MTERKNAITFKGNPMTLVGNEVKTGAPAPAATLTATDMAAVTIDSFKGKVLIVSCVPSLDTPVCDLQTKRFNTEAGKLGDGAAIITVSVDLPFAQRRWCGAADAKNIKALSDYKDHSFGVNWGVRIKELGLIARAVYVVDKAGVVRYAQIVPEVTQEPNYDAALAAAKGLM